MQDMAGVSTRVPQEQVQRVAAAAERFRDRKARDQRVLRAEVQRVARRLDGTSVEGAQPDAGGSGTRFR